MQGTRSSTLSLHELRASRFAYYCDLQPVLFCGHVPRLRKLVLWDGGEAYFAATYDALWAPLLNKAPAGSWILLLNVRIERNLSVVISSRSRVSLVEPPVAVTEPMPPPKKMIPMTRTLKWQCTACEFRNFPSSGVCKRCRKTDFRPLVWWKLFDAQS